MILVELFSTEMTFSMTLQPTVWSSFKPNHTMIVHGWCWCHILPLCCWLETGMETMTDLSPPVVPGMLLECELLDHWPQPCTMSAPVLLLITCWNWNLENVCHQHQQHIWISGYLPGHLTYLCININNSNSGILISTPHLQMKKLVNSFPPFLLIIRKAH